MTRLTTLIASLLMSISAFADWTLVPEASSVGFVSVKNTVLAESHHFKALSGKVSADGEAEVSIDLMSVETMIPIRNERMQSMLFEVAKYPSADITADVAYLLSQEVGTSVEANLAARVTLHGVSLDMEIPVIVTRSKDMVQVSSQKPMIVAASQFNLQGGVEALREIAGLASITPAVPVDFTLVFKAD